MIIKEVNGETWIDIDAVKMCKKPKLMADSYELFFVIGQYSHIFYFLDKEEAMKIYNAVTSKDK